MNTFNGMRIIEDAKMLITERKQVKTHNIRFINWIYKKIYGFKTVMIADPKVYVMMEKIVIGHPQTIKMLKIL